MREVHAISVQTVCAASYGKTCVARARVFDQPLVARPPLDESRPYKDSRRPGDLNDTPEPGLPGDGRVRCDPRAQEPG